MLSGPMASTSLDSETLGAWLAVLDELSYYELLGVPTDAGADTIREGFYRFANSFHPDGHAARPAPERGAIHTIFKRGTEAYRVLSDAGLRRGYDDARPSGIEAARRLASTAPRPPAATFRPPPPSLHPSAEASGSVGSDPAGGITGRLEDYVRQSRARPFAQEAERLAKLKEYAKAKLQLKLAMNIDPDNPALDKYLKELEERLGELKKAR